MTKIADATSEAASTVTSNPITITVNTSAIDSAINKIRQLASAVSSVSSLNINVSGGGGGITPMASGGVLPPNKPFLAMLGDQKHGTNVEAPLDTIVDAMKTALASSGYSGSQDIVLNVDGAALARVTVPNNLKEMNRMGYNVKVLEGK